MEGTASGITLREADASVAPVHYGSDEAGAWASGYNEAIDEVRPVIETLQAEVKQLREYAEMTRYHQQKHADAARELEQVNKRLGEIADERNGYYNTLIDERESHAKEVARLRAEIETRGGQ